MHNILQKKMFLFLFLYTDFSMLLLCSFFKLKELFQVKNGSTTSLLFFFGNSKNVGRSGTTLNGEKDKIALIRVRRADQTKQKCRKAGKLALCLNKRRENATTWHIVIDRNISCA